MKILYKLACIYLLLTVTGCSLISSSVNKNLSATLEAGILNANDFETVREGLPAYLLLIDGVVQNNPGDASVLFAAAKLNTTYASQFVTEPQRALQLSNKAFGYARRGICLRYEDACGMRSVSMDAFRKLVDDINEDTLTDYYALTSSWVGWIQANKGDWNAVADLARITMIMERVISLDPNYDNGRAQLYMAVLATLVPPALGGKPDVGQYHFEQAISISNGNDLYAKYLYAKHYARMMFERELHDRLLGEVISTDPEYPGLTLSNSIAQTLSQQLLEDSEEYF